MLDIPFRLLQNHTFFQDDRFKALPYCPEAFQRNSGQDRIFDKGPLIRTQAIAPMKHRLFAAHSLESHVSRAVQRFKDGWHSISHSRVRLIARGNLLKQPVDCNIFFHIDYCNGPRVEG
ncbi:hypothetical protein A5906_18750 [Bradyrhizobium sacchari]|nr:hypothetical protein A5906_18750 [Bradyrhizobium sacchari]